MAESFDLHLDFDRAGGFPGRALEGALRESIRTGRLVARSRLPGSRSLSADLGLARGTVVQAYAQLTAEGWLVSAPGSGTRVAGVPHDAAAARQNPRPAPGPGSDRISRSTPGHGSDRSSRSAPGHGPGSDPRPPAGAGPVIELRPGVPDLSSFPRTAWTTALRRALTTAPNQLLDYAEPAGLPVLREAVAGYLARTRGVRTGPEAVVITAGFTSGLSLLGRALHRLGARSIGTENPGLVRHREVLRAAGLAVTPLPVGPLGADPDAAAGRAALLTPAHQHPTGAVLAPRSRYRFIEWARRADGYLIEDDYDGEFRYDQRPVGAMQALAPERVVYAGSTSKSLAPGVRLGWLIVPAPLRRELAAVIAEAGAAVSSLGQLAMADLLTSGDYDRHIRRMRLRYRRRRAELAATIGRPLEGVAAGVHALLPLESVGDERRLISVGRRRGLGLTGLHGNGYWHDLSDPDQRAALIVGYAAPPPHSWPAALDLLAQLVQ
jgi:GntR family transcriptional regulator/MocR family aminotransferase